MADTESIFIEGISVGGFRSFGSVQRIGPFKKINVFVGTNNSGKSNVLNFIYRFSKEACGNDRKTPQQCAFKEALDRHRTDGNPPPIVFGLGYDYDANKLGEMKGRLPAAQKWSFVESVLQLPELRHETELLWSERQAQSVGSPFSFVEISADEANLILARLGGGQNQVEYLLRAESLQLQGGDENSRFAAALNHLIEPPRSLPDAIIIPAVRQITAKSEKQTWDGTGIIDALAQLQNPSHLEQDKKMLFMRVEQFVQEVTGNSDIKIEIPYSRDVILVHHHNKTLPLESLGTGIHEVIILAAACTVIENKIVCMEEPELHIHPLLQRKLLRYLKENTSNQYFISSHSSALLDTDIASVFCVDYDGAETKVTLVSTAGQRWQVCKDLGYKASDLLQANCVVWVEGPSDRIYLNHWLKAIAPELKEGIHYSIMFYGGRLLSHLSASDGEIDDFISLNHLNRRPAILIDRDRSDSTTPINATKQRICDEFKKMDAFSWVTAGRQIENYIREDLFKQALESVKSGSAAGITFNQFDRTVPDKFDKVKLGRKVVESAADLSMFDLQSQMDGLVDYIRSANK